MHAEDELDATRTKGASAWSVEPARFDLAEPSSSPPSRIGAYHVLRELGAGGMGVVYAAYHEGLDRKVALKLVHRDRAGTSEGRAQILGEAQALARLNHPNVVQIYEIGEYEEQLFVAMEHVHGETLDVWQSRPGRRLTEILDVYRQAATGLAAAHDAGLVHRDFKPANVIVGADGRVRVLDFGLARTHRPASVQARVDAPGTTSTLEQTIGGSMSGTPAYMSPEQYAGRELDARSDIFSLSVALWEALHGQRPFAGDTLAELEANITAGNRRKPPPGTDLPGRLQHALARGLERDRDARWTTLRPILDALATDPHADPSAGGRERQILFIAILAAVVLFDVVPLLVVGAATDFDHRQLHALSSGCGLLTLIGVSALFRRALLGNAYHRRMILFLGVLALVVTTHRSLAIVFDVPTRPVLLADAHILVAVCLVGAVFFARWMLVLAAITVAGILVGVLAPWLYPVGVLVFAPLFFGTLGYFWRSEARRHAG